jgi:hypothetical protein
MGQKTSAVFGEVGEVADCSLDSDSLARYIRVGEGWIYKSKGRREQGHNWVELETTEIFWINWIKLGPFGNVGKGFII